MPKAQNSGPVLVHGIIKWLTYQSDLRICDETIDFLIHQLIKKKNHNITMGSIIDKKTTPYEIFKITVINVGLSDYPCLQG